jgi:ribosomal protein S18 acetylase RimI-like enzyme
MLHARTMRHAIEQTWGWDEAWQREDFSRRLCDCSVSIVECDGDRAGGLFVVSNPASIHVEELQIMPEFQGRGIGSSILTELIETAHHRGMVVTLAVLSVNPRAKQLYERLGFKVTGFEAPFFRMQHNVQFTGQG